MVQVHTILIWYRLDYSKDYIAIIDSYSQEVYISMQLREWEQKYIILKGQLEHISDTECAKRLGISLASISRFKQKHPEIHDMISEQIDKSHGKLYNATVQRLYGLVRTTSNPGILKLILELLGKLVSRSDISIDQTKSKAQLNSDIQLLLGKLSSKIVSK